MSRDEKQGWTWSLDAAVVEEEAVWAAWVGGGSAKIPPPPPPLAERMGPCIDVWCCIDVWSRKLLGLLAVRMGPW